ncbi:hypothetical protein E1A91_A08G267100v1 [Gossypium mustelinum]|uniref:Uncharacterized protein n=1 Tax=Gossypium mustelinum TaxID=34275 RepID=A0A5D2YEZ5_GOSMU|nr:hypothetical protein E1A91_A08G267100v1 [Gossypium mustelinum]
MASRLLSFGPTGIHASAVSDHDRRKISSEPDYIGSDKKSEVTERREGGSEADPRLNMARSKFYPGCFTEKKAKQLRLMITNSSSFHDVMYHSAIASRLASDFKGRSDL